MLSLARIRSRSGLVFLLLAAVFQLATPVLSMPSQITRVDGRVVVLCTAQGLQRVWLANELSESPPASVQLSSCPLCLLAQALAVPVVWASWHWGRGPHEVAAVRLVQVGLSGFFTSTWIRGPPVY